MPRLNVCSRLLSYTLPPLRSETSMFERAKARPAQSHAQTQITRVSSCPEILQANTIRADC